MRYLSTGLLGLDFLLGGGLPARQTLLVTGTRGAGKTVLSCQVAFQLAARGVRGALVTLSSEPHQKLLESIEGFSFFQRERLGQELMLLSAHPWLRRGARETKDVLLSAVRERQAGLLVVDGLHLLEDAWRDPDLVREWVAELSVSLASCDCVGLFTADLSPERGWAAPEAAAADGLVSLTLEASGRRRTQWLEIVKLRGRPHVRGAHAVHVDDRGLHVHPRLETLPPSAAPEDAGGARSDVFRTYGPRVGFGDPGLDRLLGGGVRRGSATLLWGPAGSGKTQLAAQFLAEGRRFDEPGLWVAPGRSTESLLGRLRAGGGEPSSELLPFDPARMSADAVAHGLLERVRHAGIRRVVLDGVGELLSALETQEREQPFLAALGDSLRACGVSTLYTWETHGERAARFPTPSSLPEALRDSVVELAVEEGTPLSLRVVRARGQAFVAEPHRLVYGPRGLEVTGAASTEAKPGGGEVSR